MSIRMKIIVKFYIRISKLNLKEKQRYYLKQYMEFSTKYRFVRLTPNYPEIFKSRLEMNWKEQEKIVSKSQMNSLMLSNFFRDKFQNSMPKVRSNSLTITGTMMKNSVPNCPVCLKQYRSDSIYCLRSCGHTICGSCSQLLTARPGMRTFLTFNSTGRLC